MKTKDAFAMRDFDAARILQRPFFKSFHFDADKSDDEILHSLSYAFGDEISVIETKHSVTTALLGRLSEFQSLVARHTERLKNFYRAVAYSDESELIREKTLIIEYSVEIAGRVADLTKAAKLYWQSLELNLQDLYKLRFAERLKAARIQAGLSRKQLSDVLNITANGFGLYETGKREPPLFALIKLAKALNVSIDYLAGTTDNTP